MSRIRVMYGAGELSRAFSEACGWAEKITLCVSAVDHDHPGFESVREHRERVVYAVLGPATATVRQALLPRWADRGVWRVRDANVLEPRVELAWFEHGDEVRAFVLSGPLTRETFVERDGTNLVIAGRSTDEAICAVRGLLEKGRQLGRLPLSGEARGDGGSPVRVLDPQDLNLSNPPAPLSSDVGRRRRGSVVAADPAGVPFDERGDDDRAELMWEALLGRGALDRETAIRDAAAELRQTGHLVFERLRRDGRLWACLEETLRHAIGKEFFDQPRRGLVRAMIANAEDLPREAWRGCLRLALDGGELARDAAMREALKVAQELYGVTAQRVVRNGLVDGCLRSAINSAIRRREIEAVPGGWLRGCEGGS